MGIFSQVFREREEHERLLMWRYPWANVVYNWVIAVLIIAVFVALTVWAINVRNARIEDNRAKTEQAEKQAEEERLAGEQRKAEEEARAEKEKTIERWAEAGARQLYGIRLFIEKYHYTEKDLETYLRCPWNRYLKDNKLTDLATIIYKEDQFTACSERNEVWKEYKALAKKLFTEWDQETALPCDSAYVFAELTPDGIFLTKKFNADGYERRWQAQ